MANILDGKALALQMQAAMTDQIRDHSTRYHRPPGLAVVMVGDNPASAAYVRGKERACERVGIVSYGKHLPVETSQADLEALIAELNQDDRVDGILVQLPLPDHLNSVSVLNQIAPEKDVDGLHPINLGRLVRGETGFRSCTPAGVMELLRHYQIPCQGKQAVVIGRSILVGKPLALMLLDANATVTIAHSRTANLTEVCQSADILVAAVGCPGLVTADRVKPGAVVIDVGINRVRDTTGDRLVGDVEFDSVSPVASWITPVPGGVGPMTITMLLHNTVLSYQQRI